MYSETQLETLIQPMLDKQNKIGIEVIRRYGQKIKQIKEVDATKSTSLIKMRAVKTEADELQYEIDMMLQEQLEEMFAYMLLVAADMYAEAEYLYKYTQTPFTPFQNNIGMQNAVASVQTETKSIFNNLFGKPGFMIRDLQNPEILRPATVAEAYQTIVNESIQAVQNTVFDFDTVMRRTEQQLINSGLRGIYIDTDTGRIYTQRMDSALRNNALDILSMVQQAIQDEAGKQVGADGKELSAHMFSAPDHEPFQGHQFTNENWELLQSSLDFEDIEGQKFMGVERIIGVWNCRHFAWSIIVGYSKPRYSKAQLNQFIEVNRTGYKLPNGKHLTMYECTQKQRQYESRIRQYREGAYLAKIVDDDMLYQKYSALIADNLAMYEAFSEECGLPVYLERTKIITK